MLLRKKAALGSVPSWVIRDETGGLPSLFLNFEIGLAYYLGQVVPISSLLTVVRTSGGYNAKLDGSLQWFANNTLRQTDAGLLVEGARTNRVSQSQEIGNAPWVKRGTATVTANAALAPDGTNTADLVVVDGVNNDVYQAVSGFTVAAALATGLWIKKASASGTLSIGNQQALANGRWNINLAALSTGWERITSAHPAVTVVAPFIAGGGGVAGPHFFATSGGPLSFYAWNGQQEEAAFLSSDIPTGASAATRAADNISINDVSFIGSEGTFFAETFGSANNESYGRIVGLTSSTSALNRGIGSNNVQVYNGAQVLNAILGSGTWGGLVRSAMAYNGSGRALCGNAGTVATDANALGAVANVRIGSSGGGSSFFFGNVRKLAYYPRRVSNAGLQQMTAV